MGAFEEVKGKVKEKVGDVTGKPDLQRQGEAQQAKGAEERREAQERAKAKAHEAKAEMHEQEQRSAQD